jgi:histidinol dehydrogenase
MTLEQAELAKEILLIEDAELLQKVALSVKKTIAKYKRSSNTTKKTETTKTDLEKLDELTKQPTPKHISLEVLAKEQGYSSEKFRKALKEIDHSLYEDETLEEMLNTLTK